MTSTHAPARCGRPCRRAGRRGYRSVPAARRPRRWPGASRHDADLRHYANAYGTPGRLRSAFETYRALPANMAYNAAQTGPVSTPLLLADGEHAFGPALPPLAHNLRANYGWSDVKVRIILDGKHYLPEERPDDIAELIENHAADA